MLSIQHNMLAGNANRQLKVNTRKNSKNTEKLSSGYKINRAADDAAGLAISEKMRRQIRGLHQAADNIQEGVGYVQTAEGALNEVQDMLHRMNELAVKSANGTNTEEDRAYIDREVQALKDEMDRIFSNTAYNEQKIWDPKYKKQIGTEIKQAVDYKNTTNSMTVTNDNYGVIPSGNFIVNADATTGVSVSWTGYDGNTYETEKIDWATLKKNNYSFEMSNYFGDINGANAALYDSTGKPVFTHKVAFDPIESATVDDIVTCIDGRTMTCSPQTVMYGTWEGNSTNGKFSVIDEYLYYSASYASKANDTTNGHDFDAGDDIFLEPSLTVNGGKSNLTTMPTTGISVANAKTTNTGWTFDFNMKGLGKVTASSTGISYYASDYQDEDEGRWWRWYEYSDGTKVRRGIERSASGTLAGVMSVLTGDTGLLSKTPTSGGAGMNDGTGTIEINFSLKADNAYTYGAGSSSTSVGSFTLLFNVTQNDTEASVLAKIENALNNTTILDFQSSSAGSDSVSFGSVFPKTNKIDAPIWGGICGFYVQGGTESGEHIEVKYEALSILSMGMGETNVLTVEDSQKAIGEVKNALQMVSEQRATFGAYQNRLERAYKINENVEENTQASESVIRDTNIAKVMVEHSNNNILLQAGTSMLTQANQQSEYILQLLQ